MNTNAVIEQSAAVENSKVQLKTTSNPHIKLSKSTIFWTILSLIVFNACFKGINLIPLLNADTLPPMQATKSAVAFKVKQYKKQSNAPDILFLGSSLPLNALFHSENGKFSQENSTDLIADNVNFFQSYTSCNFFETAIEKKTGHRPNVFNLTIFASMVSDLELVWGKIEDTNKIPKQVIIGVGLRSFQDNVNPKSAQTPVYKQLIDMGYLTKNFILFIGQDLQVQRDLILSSSIPVWKNRSELKLLAEQLFTDTLHRDTRFASEKKEYKAKQQEEEKKAAKTKSKYLTSLKELDYQSRYNPPNMKQFSSEFQALNRLLAKFNSHRIAVTIVNMPVSEGNKLISSPKLRSLYNQKLQSISTRHNVNYVDFENSLNFENDDFSDTVHLNSKGSSKFLNDLVRYLKPIEEHRAVAATDTSKKL